MNNTTKIILGSIAIIAAGGTVYFVSKEIAQANTITRQKEAEYQAQIAKLQADSIKKSSNTNLWSSIITTVPAVLTAFLGPAEDSRKHLL